MILVRNEYIGSSARLPRYHAYVWTVTAASAISLAIVDAYGPTAGSCSTNHLI
jgi:hypothetical protein